MGTEAQSCSSAERNNVQRTVWPVSSLSEFICCDVMNLYVAYLEHAAVSLLVWRSWGVVKLDNKTQKNKLDVSSWGREASLHARTLFTDYHTLRSCLLCSTFIFWSYSGLWLAGMKSGHYLGEFVRSEPDPRNFSPHKSPDNPILLNSAIQLNCGVENIWVTTVRLCSSRG